MKHLLAPLLLVMMLVTACGDDSAQEPTALAPQLGGNDPTAPAGDDTGGTMLPPSGPPISVAEALEMEAGELFIVSGYLFVRDDGTMVLADKIMESFPPQPGGAQIAVADFDRQTLPLVEGAAGTDIAITAWTDIPIELYGSINNGILIGNTLAAS